MKTVNNSTELLGLINYKINKLIELIKTSEYEIEDFTKQIEFFKTTNIPTFNTSIIPYYEFKLERSIIQFKRLQKLNDKIIRGFNSINLSK